jgi:hypothetical protein
VAPLKPGTLDDFANSMAELIETELDKVLQQEGRPPLVRDNSEDSRDRRLLLVAIARGVVLYLDANATAFKVTGLTSGAGTPVVSIDASP